MITKHCFCANTRSLCFVGPAQRKYEVMQNVTKEVKILAATKVFLVGTSDGTQEDGKSKGKELVRNHFLTKEQKEIDKELRELVNTKPDLLNFGEEEISKSLQNFSLAKLYVSCEEGSI